MNKKNIKNFLVYLKDLIGKCWNDKFYSKSKEVSDEPEYINETIPNQKENDIDIIPPFKNDFDDAERYLLGLCEKLGVGFVGADVGLFRILACMSEILRLFSLFQKFGGV